jgi:hypothetical protein
MELIIQVAAMRLPLTLEITMGYYKDLDIENQELLTQFEWWVKNNYTEVEYMEIVDNFNSTGEYPARFYIDTERR